ncbi:MAG: HNH endonuclease family protein [Bifidobacteriaceae bacterium]|jgi:hypothetical protein|nr:HNH endonuclease family protein [Bifidobacteriaceae bacterium]
MAPRDANGSGVVSYQTRVEPFEVAHALRELSTLRIRFDTWEPPGRYEREAIQATWSVAKPLGLRLSDAILARDLEDPVYGADALTVEGGWLRPDPYTGRPVEFKWTDGPSARTVDLDHVVSLENAWLSGAYKWTGRGRNWRSFYNDPRNLIPTSAVANRDKGARDASQWLPENQAFRPRFVILQILVKSAFNLTVSRAELRAMRAVLAVPRP